MKSSGSPRLAAPASSPGSPASVCACTLSMPCKTKISQIRITGMAVNCDLGYLAPRMSFWPYLRQERPSSSGARSCTELTLTCRLTFSIAPLFLLSLPPMAPPPRGVPVPARRTALSTEAASGAEVPGGGRRALLHAHLQLPRHLQQPVQLRRQPSLPSSAPPVRVLLPPPAPRLLPLLLSFHLYVNLVVVGTWEGRGQQ